jgi:NAD(P)-dependent dehydrogenase (short-subunit alcohol dehydrogenase family)
MNYQIENMFGIKGKVAVVTGGGGILCGEMAKALGAVGAKVAVLDLNKDAADAVAAEITKTGGKAVGVACNVLERASIDDACKAVEDSLGAVDYLINGAGGNSAKATTGGTTVADQLDPTFFDLDPEGVKFVFNLNFLGTMLPTQSFAKGMVARKSGVIINISSMNAYCPLTKIPAYSAAKAAVTNFTQWLAVHFAPANIRVNAIAPGFFLTAQNRFLLTDEKTGAPTPRGKTIISQTPMKRYGTPDELIGALVYLLSPAANFVTGTCLAIDGGFSAFSGV